ncbi:hypothetical protein DPEC_G00290610 [Dallia pectoralis]|uniref:Uncharacterized protein n=1 Tax=Dallia pectoralis TaxID=75939 RepID=A0ACC2FHF1_DALPE|nr:hypothetical protein DPEC_G00290610 [Dallia pectoralis]
MVILYIPTVNQHMYEVGFAKNIQSDKFKQLVLSSLNLPKSKAFSTQPVLPTVSQEPREIVRKHELIQQYFYPELLADSIEFVEVTEVIDPQRVFCRLSIFSQELKKLSEQIHEYHEGRLSFCKERRPEVSGTPCTARGSNGQWCRSLLQQDIGSDTTVVEVLHVDSGETDFVPVGNIRLLAAKFLRFPVVTYLCSLQGIKNTGIESTVDEIECLKSLLLHQTVIAKFQCMHSGINCVTLYREDNVNINNLFDGMKRDLVVSQGPATRVKVGNSPPATEAVLNENVFKKICEDLCVALNPDDGMWYRAQIIQNSQLTHVDVRYIDYGTTKRVSLKDLRPLDPVFRRLNPQAFQCVLHNLNPSPTSPVFTEWSDTSSFEFQNLVNSSVSLRCTIDAVINEPECFTVTAEQCQSTHQQSPWDNASEKKLMAEHDGNGYSVFKLADLPLRPLKPGLVTEVYVSHCNSPSSFYIQMTKDRENIHLVSQSCDAPLVDLNQLQLDDLVNAEHPGDASWYRAVVRRKPGNGTVHVEFIDFGNEATILSLKVQQIDKRCLEYPRFSVHCVLGGLNNANNIETWGEEVKLIFKKATRGNGEKKLACTFVKMIGSVWEVSLEDEGIVFLHLVKACQTVSAETSDLSLSGESTIPQVYKKPCISQGQTLEVYAMSITGPNYFWCQHANSEELDRISTIAQVYGNLELQDSVLADTLSSRSPCLALFVEDNQWYRAQVIDRTDHLFTVLFVDYGNESIVDVKSMRLMPHLLLGCAPQAFLCSLDGFEHSEGNWDNSAVDAFYQLLVDKSLKVKVQNMDNNLESHTPQYQDIGNTKQRDPIPGSTPIPGSPCLALFPEDEQWYRAQISKCADVISVVFVDYGNESEVDSKSLKLLPDPLLERPPQAFLCSLNGFESSKGSWDDSAGGELYELLVDKPLKVTIQKMGFNTELTIPQYQVKAECEELVVNDFMKKFWRSFLESRPEF